MRQNNDGNDNKGVTSGTDWADTSRVSVMSVSPAIQEVRTCENDLELPYELEVEICSMSRDG